MLLVGSKNGPIRDLATMRELSARLHKLADEIDDHGAPFDRVLDFARSGDVRVPEGVSFRGMINIPAGV